MLQSFDLFYEAAPVQSLSLSIFFIFTLDVPASFCAVSQSTDWGVTVVDSFESSARATSLSVQNFYLAAPAFEDTILSLQWVLNISARAVGFSKIVEKVSEESINSAFQ
jgi:hypothetical protein